MPTPADRPEAALTWSTRGLRSSSLRSRGVPGDEEQLRQRHARHLPRCQRRTIKRQRGAALAADVDLPIRGLNPRRARLARGGISRHPGERRVGAVSRSPCMVRRPSGGAGERAASAGGGRLIGSAASVLKRSQCFAAQDLDSSSRSIPRTPGATQVLRPDTHVVLHTGRELPGRSPPSRLPAGGVSAVRAGVGVAGGVAFTPDATWGSGGPTTLAPSTHPSAAHPSPIRSPVGRPGQR